MNTTTCIYCDKARPFTDEHVFPAGLGGDDKSYLLKGLVCGVCNTKTFSPLETQLMRNSPYALARLYQQATGRGKGGKALPPEFAHDRCDLVDPVSGHVSEAEMGPGGVPTTLGQLQILGDELSLGGTDGLQIAEFLAGLPALLADTARIISKISSTEFEVTEFTWDGSNYEQAGTSSLPKPPAGIWLDSLIGSQGKPIGKPRLYKRSKGQYVLRLIEPADAAVFLSGARRQLPMLQARVIPDASSISQPGLLVGMKMDPQAIFRAMVKIGVNLACHEYGEQVVRSPSFDRIREIVLTGKEGVPVNDIPPIREIFQHDKRPVHVAMLYPQMTDRGMVLLFLLRLYGGAMQIFLLSEDATLPAGSTPVVFVVHYREHRIERHPLENYLYFLLHGEEFRP